MLRFALQVQVDMKIQLLLLITVHNYDPKQGAIHCQREKVQGLTRFAGLNPGQDFGECGIRMGPGD